MCTEAFTDRDPDIPPDASYLSTMSTTHHHDHPYRRTAATALGYSLTFIGSISDAAQKLFSVGQTLGIDDLSIAFNQSRNLPKIIYLVSGATATTVQSYCLEKSFTLKFSRGLLQLPTSEKPVAHGLMTDILTAQKDLFHADIHLNLLEKFVIRLINASGATARGVTSIMGFHTIDNSTKLEITIPSLFASITDGLQTIATDGDFLKKYYLTNRLWLSSKRFPALYSADYVRDMRNYLNNGDKDEHYCRTWPGYALHFFLCNVLGVLAIGSDVGVAKLAIDEFAELHNIDQQNLFFAVPKWLSLASLFMMMYAIDARSLANKVTSWYENRYYPEASTPLPRIENSTDLTPDLEANLLESESNEKKSTSDEDSTSEPAAPEPIGYGKSVWLGVTVFAILLGASMTAINAYTGTEYLFGPDDTDTESNPYIIAFSGLIACIKFCQSLSVEGTYTYRQAKKAKLPCQSIENGISGQNRAAYGQLTGGDSTTNPMTGQTNEGSYAERL